MVHRGKRRGKVRKLLRGGEESKKEEHSEGNMPEARSGDAKCCRFKKSR